MQYRYRYRKGIEKVLHFQFKLRRSFTKNPTGKNWVNGPHMKTQQSQPEAGADNNEDSADGAVGGADPSAPSAPPPHAGVVTNPCLFCLLFTIIDHCKDACWWVWFSCYSPNDLCGGILEYVVLEAMWVVRLWALEGCHVNSKIPSRFWDSDEVVAERNERE